MSLIKNNLKFHTFVGNDVYAYAYVSIYVFMRMFMFHMHCMWNKFHNNKNHELT